MKAESSNAKDKGKGPISSENTVASSCTKRKFEADPREQAYRGEVMKSPLLMAPAPQRQRWLYQQQQLYGIKKSKESSKELSNQVETPHDVKQTSNMPKDGKKIKVKTTFGSVSLILNSRDHYAQSFEIPRMTILSVKSTSGYVIGGLRGHWGRSFDLHFAL